MSDTTNLYEELIRELKNNNLKVWDIKQIRFTEHFVDTQEFLEVAKKTDYDSGFGGQEIPEDLIVLGDDWWLSRGEYDGSEWFHFNRQPKLLTNQYKNLEKLTCDRSWVTFADMLYELEKEEEETNEN